MTAQRRGETHVNLDVKTVPPKELLRVQRLARELRLTDQILSIDVDALRIEKTGPAPAWTTLEGDTISFAYASMPKPTTRFDIAVWLGTNAHELGHVLYSPRKGSTLMYRVLEADRSYVPGIAMLANIAEDQRQERLILTRFAPWRGYLTAALAHHLSPTGETAWLLMTGRTWLPDDVRAQAKANMIRVHGQHITDEVTRLIGEYQRLLDPGETEVEEAWNILHELHALFADDMPKLPKGCQVIDGGEPDTDEVEGTEAPRTADEADADDTDDGDDDDSDDGASGDGTDEDDDDTDGGGESADEGDDNGDEGDEGDGGASATDSNDDSNATERDGARTDTSGGGAGSEHVERKRDNDKPITRDDVRRALTEAATEAINDNDRAREDLDTIIDALDHGRGGDAAEGDEKQGTFVDATDTARQLHREVSDALLDLKDETEAGWLKRVDGGRLNVRRLMNPNVDYDELFDRYDPGMMDSTELEVVLLLDVSGSMMGATHRLAEATWAIRSAVDDLEGSTTVFAFEADRHQVLANTNDRVDGRMFVPDALGGTDPTSALNETFRVVAGSEVKNRLVIILTDGEWYGTSADRVIDALNAQGITTVLARLDNGYSKQLAALHPDRAPRDHGATFAADINDPSDLARLFRRVATERFKSWR
jgi:hypothetical protein